MSETNSRLRRYAATAAIYLALAASAFGFNIIRSRTSSPPAQPAQPEKPPSISSTKPYFSLTTNRTYSPNESARLWASYQNVDYLDFRVYHIKDPSKFFISEYRPSARIEQYQPSRIGMLFSSLWFGTTIPLILIYPCLKLWQIYLGGT